MGIKILYFEPIYVRLKKPHNVDAISKIRLQSMV